MSAAKKHFGPKPDVAKAPLIEFSVGFVRDGVEEVHEFAARPRVTYGDTVGLIKNQKGALALPHADRMIRRFLADDDGTPLRWEPYIRDGQLEAPDGSLVEPDEAPRFAAFEAGSSRRRWAHLMEVDDDVEADLEQIIGVFEYLLGEVADGRPTSRSSRSSR